MRRTLTLMLTLCLAAFAADNATTPNARVVAPKQVAVADGADAITIPQMLSYQGRLTDTAGRAVPNGQYTVTFRLYDTEAGGSPFWSRA